MTEKIPSKGRILFAQHMPANGIPRPGYKRNGRRNRYIGTQQNGNFIAAPDQDRRKDHQKRMQPVQGHDPDKNTHRYTEGNLVGRIVQHQEPIQPLLDHF